MKKDTRSYVSAFLLVQCKYISTAQTNYPGLLLEVLPCNVGVPSMVCLLPIYHGKGTISLGAFGHLEIMAIMFVWLIL